MCWSQTRKPISSQQRPSFSVILRCPVWWIGRCVDKANAHWSAMPPSPLCWHTPRQWLILTFTTRKNNGQGEGGGKKKHFNRAINFDVPAVHNSVHRSSAQNPPTVAFGLVCLTPRAHRKWDKWTGCESRVGIPYISDRDVWFWFIAFLWEGETQVHSCGHCVVHLVLSSEACFITPARALCPLSLAEREKMFAETVKTDRPLSL